VWRISDDEVVIPAQEGSSKPPLASGPWLAAFVFALFVLSSLALFSGQAVRDDDAGRLTLAPLEPAMSALIALGNWWLENAQLKLLSLGRRLRPHW
jgi:hypothetical protein